MRISFELTAEPRGDQGKGASRRLRHTGKVPAILYGGHVDARNLSLDHNKLMGLIDNEKFYSSIISIAVGAEKQPAIVKDVQMHPAKNAVLHVDLQRVLENEKIRLHVPIHFRNESTAPGIKTQGGVVSHHMADVEVVCLPKDLPEFLEVDLSTLDVGQIVHLSDLKLPAGVTIPELKLGKEHDLAVVIAKHGKEEAAAADAPAAAEVPAAKVTKKDQK